MPGAQAEQQCSTGTVSTGSSRGGCAQSAALPRACQLHPAPPRHDGYQPNPSQRTTYLRFPFCTNSWGCRVLIYRVLEATALQSSISPGKRPGEARSSFIGRAVWREEAFPGSVYRAGSNPASPWSRGLGKILTYKEEMTAPITLRPLDEQSLIDLRRHYDETSDAETRTRYQMLLLSAKGQTSTQIAQTVLRSQDTVVRVLKRFITGGVEAVPRRTAPGRERTGIQVTEETVRVYLHAHDYVCKRPTWQLRRKAETQANYA